MACKITHKLNSQQIRFANRDAAERYAEIIGGGVDNWYFATVPRPDVGPVPITVSGPRRVRVVIKA
ncbi:hypothetical protein SAMN05216266_102308 [Amycolatopsis marina]|uniref:Uncharacterized protein n=1 Tax=Amycolatopsis marina TaxID=490629 RepID=A0A1I0WXL5_9PSEU|nr:hypothetical protein [Amycolatopsis marina]SFA93542.1 hypothetical protein SAMN05216266_102308 [Amycolatopsis marina]